MSESVWGFIVVVAFVVGLLLIIAGLVNNITRYGSHLIAGAILVGSSLICISVGLGRRTPPK